MTVDSTYTPVDFEPADTEAPFEIESIGDSAMQVWVVFPDGYRFQLPDYKDVLPT